MSESMTLRVADVRDEAEDVRSYVLVDPAGGQLPAWTPGAHIDVVLGEDMTRQYSLSGEPEDRQSYRIAVLREEQSRGGSQYMHKKVRVGSELPIAGPRNNFPLAEARRYLFVAGGIGITPLLPMIREVHRRGADWRLYYGGRRRSRMAFVSELDGHGDRVRVLPEDEHGLLPLAEILQQTEAAVHCCGPEPLLAAAERAWSGPADLLRVERFRPIADVTAPAGRFEVRIASTGQSVSVEPDQSIMDALEAAGVEVPFSCREGTCASCETSVIEGEIEHRDSVLTEAERRAGKTMMVCVSRTRSPRLVLDL